MEKNIAAVIPAYNEETQIANVTATLPGYVDKIIVVNDKSSDNTAEVLKKLSEQDSRIIPLHHEINQGAGGAIATGCKWVRDNTDIDIVFIMDGDGQMDPEDLPHLIEPVAADITDFAKGNRLINGEAYKIIPKIRYFGNSALSFLTKIASGYWHIADSQTGYKAFNRKVLNTIEWDSMYKRYGHVNDILVRLNVEEFRVLDVEIKPVYHVGEQSGIKIRQVVFSIGWLLVKLFFWRMKEKYIIRDFHPLILFYSLGALLFALNLVALCRIFYLWPIQGNMPEISLLIWIFTFSNSLLCFFFGMWMDMDHCRPLNSGVVFRKER